MVLLFAGSNDKFLTSLDMLTVRLYWGQAGSTLSWGLNTADCFLVQHHRTRSGQPFWEA
jgi:hypothetical protein